jgi:sigma-B regulation protein RsbU (phosphoserine phosphatase)
VLGVFPGVSCPNGTAQLRPGDCLVLFTDRITEAMNAQDEEFGEERLTAVLSRPAHSADERRREIVAAASQFANGAFHDDATVLVMTVN